MEISENGLTPTSSILIGLRMTIRLLGISLVRKAPHDNSATFVLSLAASSRLDHQGRWQMLMSEVQSGAAATLLMSLVARIGHANFHLKFLVYTVYTQNWRLIIGFSRR